MYPYNVKTQPSGGRLRARNQQNAAPLSSDRRLRELLALAQQESAKTEQKYETLCDKEELSGAEDILHTMQMDEKKHQRILQDAVFLIFGEGTADAPTLIIETEETSDAEDAAEAENTENMLENLLLAEMDEVSFYRDLLFSMEDADLWGFFFEIVTNKQNHCAALNHLYAKYFCKGIVEGC